MNTLRTSNRWVQLTITALLVAAGAALAADDAPTLQTPSKEMRDKMAAVHEKMATCLRSDKPFVDCRAEMQHSCKTMMGEAGCPMMGMGMGMHDRMKKP